MEQAENDGQNARMRVLAAAAKVFAARGYRDAKVAEICRQAGTNIASVNYYYRSKEALYVEAWRYAFQSSLLRYPPDGNLGADATPQQRLAAHIRMVLHRSSDPESLEFAIAHKEMANPTGLLFQVMRESFEPLRQRLEEILRLLMGPEATDRDVLLCGASIMGQCMHYAHHALVRRAMPEGSGCMPPSLVSLPTADELADHIYRFSITGIQAFVESPGAEETPQAGKAGKRRAVAAK